MSGPEQVEKRQATMGLTAVLASDVAIALAAILGVLWLRHSADSGAGSTAELAAVLTSAFTAISTMTTAYFGIKSMSNTAVALHKGDYEHQGDKGDPGQQGGAKKPAQQ